MLTFQAPFVSDICALFSFEILSDTLVTKFVYLSSKNNRCRKRNRSSHIDVYFGGTNMASSPKIPQQCMFCRGYEKAVCFDLWDASKNFSEPSKAKRSKAKQSKAKLTPRKRGAWRVARVAGRGYILDHGHAPAAV
jgi:hypothetical protein